jgi:hypothetical protein
MQGQLEAVKSKVIPRMIRYSDEEEEDEEGQEEQEVEEGL